MLELYVDRRRHILNTPRRPIALSEALELQLVEWVQLCQEVGVMLVSSMIKEKAKQLCNNDSFKASDRWLPWLYE